MSYAEAERASPVMTVVKEHSNLTNICQDVGTSVGQSTSADAWNTCKTLY